MREEWMHSKSMLTSCVLMMALGCGSSEESAEEREAAVLGPYSTCAAEEHIGDFTMTLKDTYTSIQGSVTNGVRPSDVPVVTMAEGSCELLQPKTLFCDPMCGAGETCGDDGSCVALPVNQSVGLVSLEGLSASVEMDARAPVFYYHHVGDLPHPGFQEDDTIALFAAGTDSTPFSVSTRGVAELEVSTQSMPIERDTAAVVNWVAGEAHESVQIEIELNIANHGGTPARVTCLSSDVGQFEFPTSMVNALLDLGFSGFPSVSLTRVASNSVHIDDGCIDFRALSTRVLTVEIDGLISCSDNSDCPAEESCLADLTCG